MNILITGAAGFIGSHLSKKLIKSNRIIGIDNFDNFYDKSIKENNIKELALNANFKVYNNDIRDKELLNSIFLEHSINLVIHLAAKAGVRPSLKNPHEYVSVNIDGTLFLLETMKKYHVKRIVFASSSSVYGENNKVPFCETDPLNSIISTYAVTKKTGEDILKMFHQIYDFSVIALRFFTVYGPGQRPDLAIYKFIDAISNNREITIYGDGNTARDYTYIDDIVAGIINSSKFILDSKEKVFEIFNLGNSTPIKLDLLIETIQQVMQQKALKNYQPLPDGDVHQTFADITKAKRLINYQPETKLEDGLRSFYNWYIKTIE